MVAMFLVPRWMLDNKLRGRMGGATDVAHGRTSQDVATLRNCVVECSRYQLSQSGWQAWDFEKTKPRKATFLQLLPGRYRITSFAEGVLWADDPNIRNRLASGELVTLGPRQATNIELQVQSRGELSTKTK